MIDAIRDGISLMLSAVFPDFAIYGDERVMQGLKTPCFFVGLGEYALSPLPCGLWEMRQYVDVAYFPGSAGDLTELWSVGQSVLARLRTLPLAGGGMARGFRLSAAVVDGRMHVRGMYQLRLKEQDIGGTGARMEEMVHQTNLGRVHTSSKIKKYSKSEKGWE